ncbi:hypothetical protein [Nonlabens sp.]|uniref:hypothetical protein n=1 Tax=Nonlabens sp. TaxID=1888209 RepID=UPI003266A122
MRSFNFKIFVLIFFCTLFCYAQKENSTTHSNLVFFKNEQLIKELENIIGKKDTCQNNKNKFNWYVDFKENDYILVTQGKIANLMELNNYQEKAILSTVINNNVVFVVINKQNDLLFKTDFNIDLSNYVGKSVISFRDISAWLIKKDTQNCYHLVDSQIRKCD